MDTTTSSVVGADDEREEEEDEEEDEEDLDAELAALSHKHKSFSFSSAATTAAGIMASAHPNTPTSCCSSSNATPQPPTQSSSAPSSAGPLTKTKTSAAQATAEEELEERDSFHSEPFSPQPSQQQQQQQQHPQQPRSLPYHRPVPVLHHFSLTPPPRSLSVSGPPGHKCASPTLLPHHFHHHHHHHYHHHAARPLPSPQTPSQPHSLQLPATSSSSFGDGGHPVSAPVVPGAAGGVEKPLGKSVASLSSGSGSSANMSRSISDSTLRRAALHLNLSSQSVLPSFTSLQQFKV